jgi:hypothetical protein
VNGRGPYKFVLDTGSNITLFESSLFHELELKPRGTTSAKAVDGMWLGKIAYVREISIEDGVSQSNVRVLEVDGMKRPDMDVSVRGVLGEDFLHAFDLLIDNEHQLVTFDRGNVLASKLAGDHEPISSSATVHGVEVKYRPLLWAIVPSIDANRPLHLLVDTGIEETNLLRCKGSTAHARVAASTGALGQLRKGPPCVRWKDRLRFGHTTTRKVRLSSCIGYAMDAADRDGSLATRIFNRVFICHSRSYIIFDPEDVPNT